VVKVRKSFIITFVAAGVLILLLLGANTYAATSPVQFAGDYANVMTGSTASMTQAPTFIVTNTADEGAGSLRQAIIDANENAGSDVIAFAVDDDGDGGLDCGPGTSTVCSITLTSALPVISEPVAINGQIGGGPGIHLDGSGSNGLTFVVGSKGSSVIGLVINQFQGHGVLLQSTGADAANPITLENNYIGTDVTGMMPGPGNGGRGIFLSGAPYTFIKGSVISGNGREGVRPVFSPNTEVINNKVGTDVNGGCAQALDANNRCTLGNIGSGVFSTASDGLTILGNVLSNNGSGGTALVSSSGVRFLSNIIENNDAAGISLANGSSNNLIADNYISNHPNRSISIFQPIFMATDGNLARQKGITLIALNNDYNGVSNNTFLRNTVLNTGSNPGILIAGDPTPTLNAEEQRVGALGLCSGSGKYPGCCPTEIQPDGSCKLIHDDVRALLQAVDPIPRGNAILETSVSGSNGLGIDLTENYSVRGPHPTLGVFFLQPAADGVTLNDNKDVDDGPNGLQNFPIINNAKLDDDELRIHGQLKSERDKTYHVEFFATPAADADPSGHGEGKLFVGSITVDTNHGGNTEFDVVLADFSGVAVGDVVTATATELTSTGPKVYGGTSEFSAATAVTSP